MPFVDWRLPRQRWAAWVMISFLASAVSIWGFTAAGKRALGGRDCQGTTPDLAELKKKTLDLELKPADAGEILETREGKADPCVASWLRANLYADFLFIPSYSSLLAFAVFLFSSPRNAGDPAGWGWRAGALVLTVAMVAADVTENLQLFRLLDGRPAPLLPWPTTIKWWAIALALGLAGAAALWRRQAGRFLPWLIGAGGLLVGTALAIGISWPCKRWVNAASTEGMPVFFLLVLIEAVVSMVQTGPPAPADGIPAMSPPDAPDAAAGEAADPRFERAYPPELRARESALIDGRRRGVGLPASEAQVGFGLSGGGIRSATFCLGVFQGLARQGGLLKRIDFLSTVSGGGYFGGFYGRLIGRDYITGPGDVEQVLQAKLQPEVLRNLRENGRYISPNGAGDMLLAAAILLRNWVSIQLVLLVFLLSGFLALQSLRGLLQGLPALAGRFDGWEGAGLWWSPFVILPAITFLLGAFPIGWAYWLIPHENLSLAAAGAKPGSAPVSDGSRRPLRPWMVLALTFVLFLWLTLANLGWDRVWLWEVLAVIVVFTFGWWQAAMRQKLAKEPESGESPGRALSALLPAWRRRWWQRLTRRGAGPPGPPPGATSEQVAAALYRNLGHRNRLGVWVTRALVVTALLLAVALIDTLGQTVYLGLQQSGLRVWLAGAFASWTVLAGFAQRIAALFSKGPQKARLPLSFNLIAALVALILAGIVLVGVDAASHAIAWKLGDPVAADPGPALLAFAATFLLALLFGQIWPFVNDSSHQAMYSARLTRAYLGASNPKRFSGGTSVTDVLPDDDADLAHYWPPPAKKGAPVHLINVTIDETIDGRSQIVQKDRKGNGMALGPCGLSVNVDHHLVGPFGDDREADPAGSAVDIFPHGFRVFDYPAATPDGKAVFTGEMLPLGSWVGISGAAFSTGAGYRTSLGLSLLAGLGNVRLGRWWDSGVERSDGSGERTGARPNIGTRCEAFLARLFPVQIYLLDEFLARFPGTARRHWYLSDGGHFEDLGGYELVRRRLPLIVLVDAEQDADYGFEALANLVRKARLDFGAEIEFLTEGELDGEVDPAVRPSFGALERLRRGEPGGLSRAHAALARVVYGGDAPDSRLLLIKPALTGDEPEDLLQYHAAHPDFPQESTADQFFDEAQWESYRKLGEHVAETLFAAPTEGAARWCPGRMGRVAVS